MTERKLTGRPSLYRMNRAASMRIEESRRKVSVATETSQWRSTRRAPRPVRRTSTPPPAPHSRMDEREESHLLLAKPSLQLTEDRREMDYTLDMRDRSSDFVSKPLDISISGISASSTVMERSVKPDVIRVSEILIDDLAVSPTEIDETEEVVKGWRVVDCLKALKNTIFKEKVDDDGIQESKATQVEKTGGFSCSSGLCQRKTEKVDKKPSVVQTESENQGISSGLPRKVNEMDSLNERLPSAGYRPILRTEGRQLNLQDNLRPLADSLPQDHPSGRTTSVSHPPPAGTKTSVDQTQIFSQTSTPGYSGRLGNKTAIASQATVGETPILAAVGRRPPTDAVLPPAIGASPTFHSSLQKMSAAPTEGLLERERKLDAIRRLERKVAIKQRELASTRKQLRRSLEEELENNRKLESILAKIKAIRRAGEKGAFAADPEVYAFPDKGKGLR